LIHHTHLRATLLTTLSLHDALPICDNGFRKLSLPDGRVLSAKFFIRYHPLPELTALLASCGFALRFIHGDALGSPLSSKSVDLIDRKSTRLNSSHVKISYAVFCLKK